MYVLIIWMKFMSTPINAEQNQEVTLPRSKFIFRKLMWGRKVFHTLVPLCGTIYPDLRKNTVLNTFKHNLKRKYLGNLAGS